MKTSKAANRTGTKYFFVHACVEIVCFYLLRVHYPAAMAGAIALAYDFAAFLPQGLIGDFIIRHKKIPYETAGHVLMAASIFLVASPAKAVHVCGYLILGIGNAILHECGAIAAVADSEGKIFPAALFVSGGSFGLVIGQTLGIYQVSPYFLILPLLLSEALCLTAKASVRKESYPEFHVTDAKIPAGLILLIAFLVTAVRSYIAYAIPISWNKELWQTFFLFFIMGAGKALGGLLADTIGVRKTAFIGTLAAIPFLLFGDQRMAVSCIGVFFFSMTMSLTFAMCLNILKTNPGLAFGITTAGLFLGLLPAFFVQFDRSVNTVLIIVLSLLCFGLLRGSLTDDFHVLNRVS
ncbi:MAG: hypothetical protein II882_00255 [Lachnospiraceae bacterium]|nr:hypothetical protein [Lachnospiraceae bacterium]